MAFASVGALVSAVNKQVVLDLLAANMAIKTGWKKSLMRLET